MNPLRSIGFLYPCRRADSRRRPYLGSCFAYHSPGFFLTAAHCFKHAGLMPGDVCITGHFDPASLGGTGTVVDGWFHPTADVALIRLPIWPDLPPAVPMSPGPVPRWGDDFLAIGFPASVEGSPPKPRPTPRLFKGHFQRIFEHESDFGFSYLAGELSMPAPHGLSGGPVFSLQRGRVLGVVAENLETTNLRHSQETVEEDGSTTRVERLGVINYGICVMVQAIEAWAEEIIEREGPMYARPGRRDSR